MPSPAPLVLIIEDEPLVAELIRRALAFGGYETYVAPNAAAAREALLRRRPDAITLDVHLPDTNGLALLAELRRQGAAADIPAVVISTNVTAAQARQAGAQGCLPKPFSIDGLLDTMAALLEAAPCARALGE